MAFCIVPDCGEEYSDKRLALGYQTCLNCGRIIAIHQAREKAKRVAPLYSKGPTQYISDDTAQNDLHTLGRKI
jgi:hypothetical protein